MYSSCLKCHWFKKKISRCHMNNKHNEEAKVALHCLSWWLNFIYQMQTGFCQWVSRSAINIFVSTLPYEAWVAHQMLWKCLHTSGVQLIWCAIWTPPFLQCRRSWGDNRVTHLLATLAKEWRSEPPTHICVYRVLMIYKGYHHLHVLVSHTCLIMSTSIWVTMQVCTVLT